MKTTASYSIFLVLLSLGCIAVTAGNENHQERHFTGELMVIIEDNFKQMSSQVHYYLLPGNGGRMIPLKFKDRRALPDLSSGIRVEIVGRRRNGAIDVETIHVLEAP